jgi:hypothetical protein
MEGRGRATGIELCVPPDGLLGRQDLDLDPLRPERFEDGRIGSHPGCRAAPHHEAIGQLVRDVLEVLEDELVAVSPPPAPHDPVRQDDHVAGVLFPVDDQASEPVPLESGHDVMVPQLPGIVHAGRRRIRAPPAPTDAGARG